MKVRIGYQLEEVVKTTLALEDAAFILHEPKCRVTNRLRRGALKTIYFGRLGRIDPSELGDHLCEVEDHLALEFLRGLVEGRFQAPRLASATGRSAELIDCLDLLEASIEPWVCSHAPEVRRSRVSSAQGPLLGGAGALG